MQDISAAWGLESFREILGEMAFWGRWAGTIIAHIGGVMNWFIKHLNLILIILVFVSLGTFQLITYIRINEVSDWLNDYYEYQTKINKENNPSSFGKWLEISNFYDRIGNLEDEVKRLNDAVRGVYGFIGK